MSDDIDVFAAFHVDKVPADVQSVKDAMRHGEMPELTVELVDEMKRAIGYLYEAGEMPEEMSPIARAVIDEPDGGLYNVLDLLRVMVIALEESKKEK